MALVVHCGSRQCNWTPLGGEEHVRGNWKPDISLHIPTILSCLSPWGNFHGTAFCGRGVSQSPTLLGHPRDPSSWHGMFRAGPFIDADFYSRQTDTQTEIQWLQKGRTTALPCMLMQTITEHPAYPYSATDVARYRDGDVSIVSLKYDAAE